MREKIRVLVVDDSSFMTNVVSRKLSSAPEIEVVGVAHDGVQAIEKVRNLKPSVVTMDVVMPGMDGLEALEQIMAECPTPVIMLSALTHEGAEATIKALELGAIDFFLKASAVSPARDESGTRALIDKVKMAANVPLSTTKTPVRSGSARQRRVSTSKYRRARLDKVVVIGCSTGGPRSLMQVIPAIPKDIPAQILVVQHMPPGFTKSLAERLDQSSQLEVREAEAGDIIAPGQVLIAPGGYHMTVDTRKRIGLNQEPAVWGVRPCIDITMETVADVFGPHSLGVVLTGMGYDGTRGAKLIRVAGGKVYVQDESTCTVYGMPMSVVHAGHADKVVPLHQIASEITKACLEKRKAKVKVAP